MKLKTLLMIGLVIVAFTVTSAIAIDGGNSRKGGHLFKSICSGCHNHNSKGGVIKPSDKTMSQWDRYFRKAKRKHPGDIFKKIDKRDKRDINQFMFDGALDAPSEETCG
ncbi:MAG: cytochrome c [Desulfuromonadales bacterium]|nr:cytochrome c [Desulfuromonadales bacterium]